MEIIRSIDSLKSAIAKAREEGSTVGLVPTMGALHAGHLSLVERARQECGFVVVSVFVNPTQFNNAADLATYPRDEEADAALLGSAGVDVAFMPEVAEMYPEPDTRQFDLGPVAEVMEGAMRPRHFNGVAQVVSKLFDFVNPDRAYFGEKDFQQIAVIRSMARICGFDDIEIVDCPIKRHDDGLAYSSRNVRLTPEQRAMAPAIHKVLEQSASMTKSATVGEIRSFVVSTLDALPMLRVEYYQIVDPLTMQPLDDDASASGAVGCATVYCGDVRLIDNQKYPEI